MGISFRAPRPNDIADLAARLRQQDRDECALFGIADPADAIAACISVATETWVATVENRPEAVFGYRAGPVAAGIAHPWMLTTDTAPRYGVSLVRFGRMWTKALLSRYARLQNFVDARNSIAIRWLQRIGYTVEDGAVTRAFWKNSNVH